MVYKNIANFVLISKDHSMTETRRLKNVAISFQTILNFVLARKIIFIKILEKMFKQDLALQILN